LNAVGVCPPRLLELAVVRRSDEAPVQHSCEMEEPSLDLDLTRRSEVLAYAAECSRGPRRFPGGHGARRALAEVRPFTKVGAAARGQALFALRYAVTTEAGSLPRSLTVNPFWRAQERTSALLEASTER
jgi:hypothetical protein